MNKNKLVKGVAGILFSAFVSLNIGIFSVHANEINFIDNKQFVEVIRDLNDESDKDISELKAQIKTIFNDNKINDVEFVGWKYIPFKMGRMKIIVKTGSRYIPLDCGIAKDESGNIFIEYVNSNIGYSSVESLLNDMSITDYEEF